VGAKDGDPARAVPARHARVVHVGGRVAGAGAHGMGVEVAWGEEGGGQQWWTGSGQTWFVGERRYGWPWTTT
jgi:hypothetical protein